MNDLISVIIPVYNVEPYLRRCVDSILTQSYQGFEILLIDDGSTDASGKICDEYAEQDSRIIVIHQKNKGVSAARNAGLDACNGEYIAFVDADDWIEKCMLQELATAVKKNEADFAVCNEIQVSENMDGAVLKKRDHWPELNGITVVNDRDIYRKVFARTAVIWNKLVRRSVIGACRFNQTLTYGEDTVFFLEVLQNCSVCVIVPGHFYNYFIHRPGNVVSAEINKKSLELLKNAEDCYIVLSKRGYPDVGVSRLISAIYEVNGKIPKEQMDDPKYSEYVSACRRLARFPKKIDVVDYMKSNISSLKGRLSYLLMYESFSLWLELRYRFGSKT